MTCTTGAHDALHIEGIRAYGYTGFFAEEQKLGQWFEVDLTLWLDLSRTGASDALEQSLNYATVVTTVQGLVQTSRYRTIERLNSVIVEAVLALGPVQRVRSRLTKVAAPIAGFDGRVAVEMVRDRHDA
ncbi:MAG: dihydroneopterin aldolase [Cyanobacteriota bacterium]|nr:dihydroneopterin aldolase [Cyanobacteriota bacterium]